MKILFILLLSELIAFSSPAFSNISENQKKCCCCNEGTPKINCCCKASSHKQSGKKDGDNECCSMTTLPDDAAPAQAEARVNIFPTILAFHKADPAFLAPDLCRHSANCNYLHSPPISNYPRFTIPLLI